MKKKTGRKRERRGKINNKIVDKDGYFRNE
jgi:hypothetical protein